MQRIKRFRPTPAGVLALIAIFIVLGGSAVAAKKLSGSKIKSRSISGSKLKKNSVSSTELKDGAVIGTKLGNGTVTGSKLGKLTVRSASTASFGTGQTPFNGNPISRKATANCNAGETAISGGTSFDVDNDTDSALSTGYLRVLPDANGKPVGYEARGLNDINKATVFTVQVTCLG